MNVFYRVMLIFGFIVASMPAMAQDSNSVSDLIKQGTQLNDQRKYTEAIEKYNEALKTDPENAKANYEIGFSLFASWKGNDGIPYVEKAIKGNGSTTLMAACYDLLGSIYDEG